MNTTIVKKKPASNPPDETYTEAEFDQFMKNVDWSKPMKLAEVVRQHNEAGEKAKGKHKK